MSLLYPDFLWALLLNIIPVIIHLFNLQKHETIYFSDLTLLKSIEKETKNISRLKNIIVLILRMLMITSLVLAFCVPENKGESFLDSKKDAVVGIYLDNSFSMLRTSNEKSLLNNAKDDLMHLVENLPKKTKYILTTNSKKENKPFSISKQDLINKITGIKESSNSLKFNEIIDLQKEQSKNTISKSYWFSDLHKKDFNLSNSKIDSTFPIDLIHYKSNKKDNLSIDSVWFSDKNRRTEKDEELNVKITNYSTNEIEFQTKLSINSSELVTQSLDVVKPNQSEIISFNFKTKSKGLKNGLVSITDADYNDQIFDDHYFFTYSIGKEYEVLHLFENELNIGESLEVLYGSVEKTKFNSLDIKKGFTAQELHADLVILDGISSFNSELVNGLIKKSNGDQNLIYIPPNNYQNKSNKLFEKFNIKFLSTDSTNHFLDDKTIDYEFFKSVFSKKEKNINLPYFKKHLNIKLKNSAISLLKFDNNKPLLVGSEKNGNKLFLFTSSLIKASSNLTNHALFVPVFLKIKEDCSNDFTKQFKIDNIPFLKLNNYTQQNGQLIIVDEIESPSFSFFPTLLNNQGNSLINCQSQINKDGHFYVLEKDSVLDGFSVNYSREESDMSFYSKEEFVSIIRKSLLSDYIKYFEMNSSEDTNIFNQKQGETQYWKYFVLLALIFIGLEISLIKLTE